MHNPSKITKSNSQGISPCRKRSPAKGVRQKESGNKVTKKVTEASEKVTEKSPETEKSDRTPFADLLLRHPENYFRKHFVSEGINTAEKRLIRLSFRDTL